MEAVTLFGISVEPSGALQLTSYEAGRATRRREAHSFSVSFSRSGMTVVYNYREINGESPFAFDHLVAEDHISLDLSAGGALALRVKGGIDIARGDFDPLKLFVDWSPGARVSLAATYDVTAAAFSRIDLSGDADCSGMKVEWSVPYDASAGRFERSTVKVAAGGEAGKIFLLADFDLNDLRMDRLTLRTEMVYAGWGISLGGRLDVGASAVVDQSFGLFHDFSECLRVGIERRSGQVWLYTSILAFPEAILRYSPGSTQVEVGR